MLKRSQIYGAIAFYLDHEAEIDRYLAETQREFEECGVPMAVANPALWGKIPSWEQSRDRRIAALAELAAWDEELGL